VLEGTLRIRVGTEVVEAGAGAAVSCHGERLTPTGIQAPGPFVICWS
jgi:hypothetical protein